LVLIVWMVLRFTTFGRHVYATGGNTEAARRAGINVVMVRVTVFALASMLAAAAGILESSREISAAAQVDPTLLLNAIAAAVIGGVSLFGGRGSPWAVFMGGLVIVGLLNGLSLRSASGDIQQMIEGAVLILAIMLDAVIRRRNAVSGR
ncbi:MAG TPA: inner-membrane translocator, partial [Ktedonobacterales bacterium]|nr:inner-membrane translocator [Ktedonobacterales bacterium]